MLISKDVSQMLMLVHNTFGDFRTKHGLRTTTFVYPHEYGGAPFGSVGLFSFKEDKSICFAVMSDGTINEITPNYFPQYLLEVLSEKFMALAEQGSSGQGSDPNGQTKPSLSLN